MQFAAENCENLKWLWANDKDDSLAKTIAKNTMTRVMISAASLITQAGLESLLQIVPEFEVVASLSDVTELLPVLEWQSVDVVLMEWLASDHRILQQLTEIGLEDHLPPILVLAHLIDRRHLMQALALGVQGILPHSASAEEIVSAIKAIDRGLVVLHPDISRDWFEEYLQPLPQQDEQGEPLTHRELEVLTLLSQGISNKAIAAKLMLSEHTIKFHISAIFEKLRASSRTEAVSIGIRRGLIML
jgi:two-component system, NarL family, response regulator YdfI